MLRAMLDRAAGERKAAADALEHALALAEDEPYRDAFLLHDPAVRELLEHQAHIGTAHPALVEVLLDAMTEGRSPHGEALAEPLTAREQRILGYLPTMLSNAEIGAETFVSLNTVKTHLRSIYRKLGVSSRAEAVERARRLGLLPAGIRRPRAAGVGVELKVWPVVPHAVSTIVANGRVRQPPHLDQFEPQTLDPVEHAPQRGLV